LKTLISVSHLKMAADSVVRGGSAIGKQPVELPSERLVEHLEQ
jgi:hypothetical protein